MKYLKFIDMWGIKPLLGAQYALSLRDKPLYEWFQA
jgi:hypothetical protein